MADKHSSHNAVVDNDYAEHEKTYDLFLVLLKWGTIGSLVLLLLIGSLTHTVPWWFTFLLTIGMFAASNLV